MEPEFWLQRWRRGEIGFHLDQPNPRLVAHWSALALPAAARVLVPLCGKSRDLAWLAERGHHVIGVELSSIAVTDFFREQLAPSHPLPGPSRWGNFDRYRTGNLEILCGDCFDLERSLVGPLGAVYDRAALVALPEPLRQRYVRLLTELLPSGAQMLLVTFDYPQAEMAGPPFSVGPNAVQALYGAHFAIELLASADILDAEPRFRQRGLRRLHEHVFHLRRR